MNADVTCNINVTYSDSVTYSMLQNVTYPDSFGVEHIPKKIGKFIENKNIITNIYRIQAHDSIVLGYSCIGFMDFMLKSRVS